MSTEFGDAHRAGAQSPTTGSSPVPGSARVISRLVLAPPVSDVLDAVPDGSTALILILPDSTTSAPASS